MKLYTKRTFLASIMFVLAAFSFATNFCSVSLSDSKQDSLIERIKAGVVLEFKENAIYGFIRGFVVGSLFWIKYRHRGSNTWQAASQIAVRMAARNALFSVAIGIGAGGLVACTQNTVEATQTKAKNLKQSIGVWWNLGFLLDRLSPNVEPGANYFVIFGGLVGALIGINNLQD